MGLRVQLSKDDKYLNTFPESYYGWFVTIDENYNPGGYFSFANYYRYLYIPTYNRFLRFQSGSDAGGNMNTAYNGYVTILDGGNTSTASEGDSITGISELGTITIPAVPNGSSNRYYYAEQVFLSADYTRIFIPYIREAPNSITKTNVIWVVYDVDDLLHTDGNGDLDPIFTEIQRSDAMPFIRTGYCNDLIFNSRCSEKIVMVTQENNIVVWNNAIDKNNVIMVKYKDMWFQRLKYGQLTAGQPDVKNGKTFIGWMGYPEIGTNTDI